MSAIGFLIGVAVGIAISVGVRLIFDKDPES